MFLDPEREYKPGTEADFHRHDEATLEGLQEFSVPADRDDERADRIKRYMERQELAEAEAVLQRLAEQVVAETGTAPEFLIKRSENTKAAIRSVVADDPDIKILILAAAMGGRGPGPLVASIAKEGVNWGARKLPVTVVPGDLTDEEIADLA